MKVILVDDEQLLLDDLAEVLGAYVDMEICGRFTNSQDALDCVRHSCPDVVFLDINMPGMSGMELAEQVAQLAPHIEIVFITAYDEYAIKAFELQAIDYLLKPVDDERIARTLGKLRQQIAYRAATQPSDEPRVQYFGKFELLLDERPLCWRSRKAQEFVAFVLSRSSKSVHKNIICEALYPSMDERSAVLNVQSSASRARQSLGDCGFKAEIVYNNDGYQIIMPPHKSDIAELENLLCEEKHQIARIRTLYKEGYMAENGWLWAHAASVLWEERVLEVLGTDFFDD